MPMATSRTPRRASSGFTCVCARARERKRMYVCARIHPCVCVREIRIQTQRQSERERQGVCVRGGVATHLPCEGPRQLLTEESAKGAHEHNNRLFFCGPPACVCVCERVCEREIERANV
jgi:hypothetical protein